MLQVQDLSVFYGQFQALRDVSFRVNPNEIFTLIGPNGHGKSTILRAIVGLLPIKRGQIYFEGKRIDNMSTSDIINLGITLVTEEGNLFNEMTVLENLMLGAFNPKAWKEREQNLAKVFDLFPNLLKIKNRLCMHLSGGERRCVAIGRGLMSSSKLLMLDEPTFGLAPILAKSLVEKVKQIKESGTTVILVEENIQYVKEIADRACIVGNGKTLIEGSADEILQEHVLKKTYLGRI